MAHSLFFENEVAALRAEVEKYLELGVCVLPTNDKRDSLSSANIVYMTCGAIAKHNKRPFVFSNYQANGVVLLHIPGATSNSTKYLRSMFILVGEKVDRFLYGSTSPISYTIGSKMTVRFIGDAGKRAFDAWLEAIKTDGNMRFELKLPLLPRK